jgi:hypothetical protein
MIGGLTQLGALGNNFAQLDFNVSWLANRGGSSRGGPVAIAVVEDGFGGASGGEIHAGATNGDLDFMISPKEAEYMAEAPAVACSWVFSGGLLWRACFLRSLCSNSCLRHDFLLPSNSDKD